jgi:hypothetical protein
MTSLLYAKHHQPSALNRFGTIDDKIRIYRRIVLEPNAKDNERFSMKLLATLHLPDAHALQNFKITAAGNSHVAVRQLEYDG